MGRRSKLTAHSLVRPAVEGLLDRARSAADRVVRELDDDEAVHDFRVALRRLRTILRASRKVYGKKRVKRLEALAKEFGDATSALRDAEVLEDTLRAAILDNHARAAAATWLDTVKAKEGDLRSAAVALLETRGLEDLFVGTRRLLTDGPRRDPLVAEYAESAFDAVREGVRELLPVEPTDVDRLHRLRIRFKRLRYTAEMLAQFMTVIDATGPAKKQRREAHKLATRFSSTARDAARMQKELGLLHDADQALALVTVADIPAEARAAMLTALTDLRRRLVERSLTLLGKLPRRIVGDGPVVVTAETPQRAPA